MNTSFAAQYAPDVALPPYGEWVEPEPQAGLSAPDALYDSRGNPLNYIQQGGVREYLAPRGQAVFAAPPGPTTPQRPFPIRGRTPSQTPDYPLGANTDPQQPPVNSGPQMLPPALPQPYNGPRAPARIPDALPPRAPLNQEPQMLPPALPQPYNGPRAPARIPDAEDPYNSTVRPTVVGERGQNRQSPAGTIQSEINAGTAGGLGTLQRILEEQGFNISNFLERFRGRAPLDPNPSRRSASGAERESELRPIADPRADISMIDTPPNVTPVTANYGNSNINYNGRAQEVYDLLISRGIRLTPNAGVRNNNALAGGHPEGNSIDIPPEEYERAIAIIRERYPNMPLQPLYIRRGQRFRGGVVATANHYHVDMGDAALH